MNQVSATHARVHLGALLRQVRDTGEPVVVARVGEPLAVLISLDEYERLRCGVSWKETLDLARKVRWRMRRELGKRSRPTVEELIRAGRDQRDLGPARLR